METLVNLSGLLAGLAWVGYGLSRPAHPKKRLFLFVALGLSAGVLWLRGIGSVLSLLAGVGLLAWLSAPFRAFLRGFFEGLAGRRQSVSSRGADDSLRAYAPTRPRHDFSAVRGMAETKARLREAMAAFEAGIGLSPDAAHNGILLYGDPGNGKTFIAEAVAGELGFRFLPITFGDVASKWVNQTTEQIMRAFDTAEAAGRCVLFLDEADSFLMRRDLERPGYPEIALTTNAILTRVVGLRGSGVLLIAATNFLDQIDGAARREGRFDFKIQVPPPDYEARLHLLQAFLPRGAAFADGARERLARRWEGFSNTRIKSAVRRAARRAAGPLSFDTVMLALREVQGEGGDRLPENTRGLAELAFGESLRERLGGLSNRMREIDRVESLGGSVPKAVLFSGPPGTGKTAVAKALAKDSGWGFLATTGETLARQPDEIDRLLAKAADYRPCMVFIDEADDILMARGDNPWGTQSTNKLLAAIDGSRCHPDVMFVAATNFPLRLDGAALRGGRFAEQYAFELPDQAVTRRLVSDWMARKKQTPFAPDFTVARAARLLRELSPADVEDRLQRSVDRVVSRLDGAQVSIHDLAAVLGKKLVRRSGAEAPARAAARPSEALFQSLHRLLEVKDGLDAALAAAPGEWLDRAGIVAIAALLATPPAVSGDAESAAIHARMVSFHAALNAALATSSAGVGRADVAAIRRDVDAWMLALGVLETAYAGARFDPHRHHAVGVHEGAGAHNSIGAVLRQGYVLGARLIRPAMVKVCQS